MSNVPYYLPKGRSGLGYGHGTVEDGILKDGLWDPYNDFHMGNCGEKTAKDLGITRQDQDAYAIESYRRAKAATEAGKFRAEMAPVTIAGKRGKPDTIVDEDEEFKKVSFDKFSSLKAVFQKDGTVTAANASSLNDGAAALLLMSAVRAQQLGLTPLARVVSYADAEVAPVDFGIAPTEATVKALKRACLAVSDIEFWEINEAFSVVPLANQKLLALNGARLNMHGGGVSLGHPIGCSGARITGHLAHMLANSASGVKGCASICNGGGGASAIILERM